MPSNPIKAEALNEPLNFDYDGESYTVAPSAAWDLDVLESVEEGKMTLACRALLGPAQWATFRSKPRTASDLGSLFEAITAAMGVQGN